MRFWILEACGEEVVVAYFEVQDPGALDTTVAQSQHPFDVWYRQKLQQFHNLDVTQIRRDRLDPVFVWPDLE